MQDKEHGVFAAPKDETSRQLYVAGPKGLGEQRLFEQHEVGELPDPAGHRRNGARYLRDRIERHVTSDTAVLAYVDAYVYHRRARFDHIRLDKTRLAGGGHQHICLSCPRGEVAGVDVADGNGRVAVQQEERKRLADNVAG